MNLADDLENDFSNVFFSDFNDTAVINDEIVIGYLSTSSHQFLDLDTNQQVFSTSVHKLPTLKRRQILVINGKNYEFVTTRRTGDLNNIIVEVQRT